LARNYNFQLSLQGFEVPVGNKDHLHTSVNMD
jgi:hypothetical protein